MRLYPTSCRISTTLLPSHHRCTYLLKAHSLVPRAARIHASALHLANRPNKDPYNLLGVDKKASPNEIKKAYYAKAKELHPDTSKDPDAKDKFHELQQAYDILSDEKKRASFDQHGQAEPNSGFGGNAGASGFPGGSEGFSGGFPGGFPGGSSGGFPGGGFGGFGAFGGFDRGPQNGGTMFDEIFRQFGGGGAGARGFNGGEAGRDVNMGLRIGFMEAIKGVERLVTYQSVVNCDVCGGSGMKKGAKHTRCGTCGGSGSQAYIRGGFQMSTTCTTCGGSGMHIPRDAQCSPCQGQGKAMKVNSATVAIPAGVDTGMKVRVTGKGDAALTGNSPAGDLYVHLDVQPHPIFHREGRNIFVTASVPLHMALLGGTIRVPTVDGDVELTIPPGTQPDEKKRLPNRGVVRVGRKDRGDEYITLKIDIPRHISENQRRAFLEAFNLAESNATDSDASNTSHAEAKEENLFDRMKRKMGMRSGEQ
ncbi:hypothetical protein BJ741DRAFT_622490 [Chytriomyces cf. hyalinus JEL632]|nr:hypothetical protein BJ741DRAFT_622490 [Chytriomyces cf. hyalinus JEL632]